MVIWSKAAKIQLQKAFNYISLDSPQKAEKIRDQIIDLTISLSRHPESYPPDKYKRTIVALIALLKSIIIEFPTVLLGMTFTLSACDIQACLLYFIR